MEKLISFIIRAEKGFFKKPDINDTRNAIYLTFNILHKPAALGILGAIIGLSGYKKNEELPEYYIKLQNIPIGIKPIGGEKGVFQKTIITYNNTTGFASEEAGGNLMISEQTLLNPAYKIYLLLDLEDDNQSKLYENIKNQKAEFLPYMGKNDYSLWWDKNKVEEHAFEHIEKNKEPFKLSTIFIKKYTTVKEAKDEDKKFDLLDFSTLNDNQFISFERLPIGLNEKLFQYDYADFAYTNFKLKKDAKIDNIYKLNNGKFIQLN